MTSSLRGLLIPFRFRISKFFGIPSQVASLERAKPSTVTEEPDYYRISGFHPISLGDTFHHGQYTILRKLGYGQYSTVWLAGDSGREKYVALKVLRADCYGGPHDIFEREILSRVSEISNQSSHPGCNYVSHLLEQFKHAGPNGEHVCLVFDVLGHHLGFQAARYEDGKLPVQAVKGITWQLLLGLDFLHRECGIIHTDLKPTNILLELDNSSSTVSQYLSEVPVRVDSQCGAPLREVIPTPLISETQNFHIRIIDFGVASWKEKHLSDLIQSPALRAPEVTIGAPWDSGVDIWSLGCLVMEFVQGIVLFSGKASSGGIWTAEDDHLARMIEILGNLLRIPIMEATSLERLVNGKTMPFLKPIDMADAEVPAFIDFLKGMLAIDPACRKSAAELLEHDWIRL
ncbi:protein kinase [Histoplasma capsulatum var. duboisii H88]|uniref:non-specific serine/threonine protein kinase n=1 Tax=Ajellomyces capsulatus (strain H88) TaxID=544711 RepID=F0UFK1_AJEC8|nr:protein kinase [Histoplasma capsulatum var. duboisii H88]